ncbi:hypothetical protein E9232_006848 [Inquilinus ginsengisoli]|uniref:DUF3560 domain-containing protein n=1 Tax=Inquilinus ginsengisoli TaxID=363840 RepID=A0ABU1K0A0_9PROT|nr:DUF3560 domain-containing protein [Inquilinus ginsengisoli]MDR6294294.1 hypothetical protein [Inquilinus ginsengisoli]
MNRYEAKQEARRARLKAWAERAATEATAQFQRADAIASMIPFGQPILIGHHSEGRHRADLKRIHNGIGKGVEATKQAETLQQRAAAVGTAGISSDDPEAVAKLKAKLAKLEEDVARMKRANAALRREDHNALVELGFTGGQIAKLREPDFAGRVGFPAYVFTNAGAEARRLRARIQRLERRQHEESRTYALEDGTRIVFNVEANRVQVLTPGKPDEARRRALKGCGFRWAPSEGAWQRHLSLNALWEACRLFGAPFPPPVDLLDQANLEE